MPHHAPGRQGAAVPPVGVKFRLSCSPRCMARGAFFAVYPGALRAEPARRKTPCVQAAHPFLPEGGNRETGRKAESSRQQNARDSDLGRDTLCPFPEYGRRGRQGAAVPPVGVTSAFPAPRAAWPGELFLPYIRAHSGQSPHAARLPVFRRRTLFSRKAATERPGGRQKAPANRTPGIPTSAGTHSALSRNMEGAGGRVLQSRRWA